MKSAPFTEEQKQKLYNISGVNDVYELYMLDGILTNSEGEKFELSIENIVNSATFENEIVEGVQPSLKSQSCNNPNKYTGNYNTYNAWYPIGLAVKNIFYVSVLQRVHEFAQLRAIGATYQQIKSVVKKERDKIAKPCIVLGTIIGFLVNLVLH